MSLGVGSREPRGMNRRQVLSFVIAAAGLASVPAFAQTRATPKIGVLWHAGTPEEEAIFLEPLKKGFSDLGYSEGRDYELVRFGRRHDLGLVVFPFYQ
jgi:putative tryptophan/tyrosine transport system substrate-binding protein